MVTFAPLWRGFSFDHSVAPPVGCIPPVIPVTDPRIIDILQSGPWPTGGAARPTLILWTVNLEIENGDRQR